MHAHAFGLCSHTGDKGHRPSTVELAALLAERTSPADGREVWMEEGDTSQPGRGFSDDNDTVSSELSRDRAPLGASLPHSRVGPRPTTATSGRPEQRPPSPPQMHRRYQGGRRFLSRLPGGTSQKDSCWDAKKESSKRDTWQGGPKVSGATHVLRHLAALSVVVSKFHIRLSLKFN